MLRQSKQSSFCAKGIFSHEQELDHLYRSDQYSRQKKADVLLSQWEQSHDAALGEANRYILGDPIKTQPLFKERADGFIDLHGHARASVYYFVRRQIGRTLMQAPSSQSLLKLVTGQGHHSQNGVPALRTLVQELCDELDIKWTYPTDASGRPNQGRLLIQLQRPSVPSEALRKLLSCYPSVAASQAAVVCNQGSGLNAKPSSLAATSPGTIVSLIQTDDADLVGLDVSPSAPEGTAAATGTLIVEKASLEEEGLDVSASAPDGSAGASALSEPIERPSTPLVACNNASFFSPQKSTLSAYAKEFVPKQFTTQLF